MIDPLAHWNDVLTVLAFAIAAITGYYQVQHYRAQQADVNIVSIEDSTYGVRTTGLLEPGEVMGTGYSITVLVENDGREPATISEFSLLLLEIDEELSLESELTKVGSERSVVQLGANDRTELRLSANGDELEEYEEVIEGILRLDTTAGVVEREITLHREA